MPNLPISHLPIATTLTGSNLIPVVRDGVTQQSELSHVFDSVDQIQFNTSSDTILSEVGKLYWNDQDGTLNLGLKGGTVSLQIGQEQLARVVNKTDGDLLESEFRVVRIRTVDEGGAQGQRPAVVLAQADNRANSTTVLGVVTETIGVNQEGFITITGQVRNIDTTGEKSYNSEETWLDGDLLFLSDTHPGFLTNVPPVIRPIPIGIIEYAHQNQGKLFVRPSMGTDLDEIHDVRITTGSLTTGSLLSYNGSLWVNEPSPILTSPNGTKFYLTVNDSGSLGTTPV